MRWIFFLVLSGIIFPVEAQLNVFAELKGSPLDLAGWNTSGTVEVVDTKGDPDANLDELLLSKIEKNTFGTCFFEKPLKLAVCKKWIVEFSFRIFDGSSADGLAFCFVKDRPIGQQDGGNIGIPDNPIGIMIVFDTHDNGCGNTENPELQIRYGDGTQNYNECGPGVQIGGLDFLRRDEYNKVKIEYEGGSLRAYLNDSLYLEGIFPAEFEGYFGFTSATGDKYDNHSIKDVTIYAESNQFQESFALSFCDGDTLTLDAGEGFEKYTWSNGSTDRYFKTTTGGSFAVVAQNTCNTVLKKYDIKLLPKPVTNLGKDTLLCDPGEFMLDAGTGFKKYIWDDGSTNQQRIVENSGNYWVMVEDQYGCKGIDSVDLIFSELPVVKIESDSFICKNTELTLKATPGFKEYLWSDGKITPNNVINNPGTYWVKITDDVGCNGSDTISIDLTPSIKPSLGNDTIICEATTLSLNPGSYTSYLWQDGTTNPVYAVTDIGYYWVKTIDKYGCAGGDSIEIGMLNFPRVDLGGDTSLCFGKTLTLNAGYPKVEYLWNDGSTNPVKIVTGSGVYEVTLKNKCGEVTDGIVVKNDFTCDCPFYCPNAFSPNNDGYNDYFKVDFTCEMDQYKLTIYNRWGELIFSSDNPEEVWEGPKNNETAQGIYVWNITGVQYNENGDYFTIKKMGTVTLLR